MISDYDNHIRSWRHELSVSSGWVEPQPQRSRGELGGDEAAVGIIFEESVDDSLRRWHTQWRRHTTKHLESRGQYALVNASLPEEIESRPTVGCKLVGWQRAQRGSGRATNDSRLVAKQAQY